MWVTVDPGEDSRQWAITQKKLWLSFHLTPIKLVTTAGGNNKSISFSDFYLLKDCTPSRTFEVGAAVPSVAAVGGAGAVCYLIATVVSAGTSSFSCHEAIRTSWIMREKTNMTKGHLKCKPSNGNYGHDPLVKTNIYCCEKTNTIHFHWRRKYDPIKSKDTDKTYHSIVNWDTSHPMSSDHNAKKQQGPHGESVHPPTCCRWWTLQLK